jgi:ATP-dependent exoDNAse (exonuclease V) beta subunit
VSNQTSFTVYSASAGSGKTFTLVKEYLLILLKNKDNYYFQKVLAITFTNKAAAEMKERVLTTLQNLANNNAGDILELFVKETDLNPQKIQYKAKNLIEAILSDYSGLSITTIDSFTHRIIRAFTYDLGLSMSFDVEMDTKYLLQEAVDNVIDTIGKDPKLTKALISFSHQKSAEDKAWDISKSLNSIAGILANESDKQDFNSIADKQIDDYLHLQTQLNKDLAILCQKIKEIGLNALRLIDNSGIQYNDFYRSMLPNHFISLTKDWKKARFHDQSTLKKRIEENKLYSQSKTNEIKAIIENILPQLQSFYYDSEKLFNRMTLLQLFNESIVPMSVLSYINSALNQIKSENNIMLISEFNELIYSKIKDEPAPFIYERLGEKYQNYFIDEMQDTSILQWKNLIKLIDNALAQEGSSLLLVGDVKQAIYRWRGGEPEQFIKLADQNHQEEFHTPKKVKNLDTNYRSFSKIIFFNNTFFQHSSNLIKNKQLSDIYKTQNSQKLNTNKGGYIQIDFIKKDKISEEMQGDATLLYPEKILETIKELEGSFKWKDICVLVRKNSQGIIIANFLTEQGIDIISSESLLLANNQKVNFLINLLQILWRPKDMISRYDILDFLYNHFSTKKNKHQFVEKLVQIEELDFFVALKEYGIDFSIQIFHQKSLYDGIEYAIRSFKLTNTSDAYIQFFLDVVLDFQIKNGSDLSGFLTFFDLQKEKLSVSIPQGKNAVQIMTIHKSKGLQFPVVIFPYDLDMYKQINPTIWYPITNPDNFSGFNKMQIPYRNSLQFVDKTSNNLYNKRQETLQFDSYNLLYVTLTRAVEQLYILTDYRLDKNGIENTKYYSGLFINYLKSINRWNPEQTSYSFGKKARIIERNTIKSDSLQYDIQNALSFISTDIAQHQVSLYAKSSILWDTEQGKAIDYGNLIHSIFANIYTKDDVEIVLQTFLNKGIINKQEQISLQKKIDKVLNHPILNTYYQQGLISYNEREMINDIGVSLIPDRVVILPDGQTVIIDYKTGLKEEKHRKQISSYADYLSDMGYQISKKLLVYIKEDIEIVSVD